MNDFQESHPDTNMDKRTFFCSCHFALQQKTKKPATCRLFLYSVLYNLKFAHYTFHYSTLHFTLS